MEEIFEKSESIVELFNNLQDQNVKFRFAGEERESNIETKEIIKSRIDKLINSNEEGEITLLLRGETKAVLKKKLVKKLNSNDSLYDGIFLVGDKAKNYLEKEIDITTPVKNINKTGKKLASWIFDQYKKLSFHSFFQDEDNRDKFIEAIANNKKLIDCYLFGLHTTGKEYYVNFLSSTPLPETAFNDGVDKIIIVFWISRRSGYTGLYVNREQLKTQKEVMESLELPVWEDSFYPDEEEYGIKGFIIPNFILGVIDCVDNEFILNPRLLEKNEKWIEHGFNVEKKDIFKFIKSTDYQRYLMLYEDDYEEGDVEGLRI